jgi:hypothetical protein
MKKIILPFLLFVISLNVNGQCVPNAVTVPGTYYVIPDSATNFVDACPNTSYTQIMYMKAPKDTTITITIPLSATIKADIDSFVVSAVIAGLPSYLNVTSVPTILPPAPNNPKTNFKRLVVKGDSLACVVFAGSVPSNAVAGSYPLNIQVQVYLSNIHALNDPFADAFVPTVFPGRKADTSFVLNDYRIIVKPTPCSPAKLNDLEAHQFNLIGCLPNPANSLTQITFEASKLDNFNVKIVNAMGQLMFDKKVKSVVGLNYIKIDASTWAKGVYMYSLTDGKNTHSKKIQVQ